MTIENQGDKKPSSEVVVPISENSEKIVEPKVQPPVIIKRGIRHLHSPINPKDEQEMWDKAVRAGHFLT